ncbi:hypothetical protein SAMN03159488_02050 [Pseudomonas sp. NFIX10]|uniref:hypothetical protein n=1 Tax=unclassified Pseudomonas TaxID=196821 RepID=UPI0008F004EA|nr:MULTISPECIES: hypothetical protein [unclassified Pseudomonas]SFB13219.1 hypothetical protein SAMN03159488_02050 [Pseudomonas sp. NFIX10]SFE68309.1 hypothetical protein SAMN03159367_01843 [Pseudomonas sp. NFACC06-1]
MKNAVELLQQYLDAIQTPFLAAALFAEDGVLELPYLESLGIPLREGACSDRGFYRLIAR